MGVFILCGGGAAVTPVPVSLPLRWMAGQIEAASGWRVVVAHARWSAWRSMLEVSDLTVQIPQGGRLHCTDVKIHPLFFTVLKGGLITRWRVGEVRIDPDSWGVYQPMASEILSVTPVLTTGSATAQFIPGRLYLREVRFQGPSLWFEGEGWLGEHRRAQLDLVGAVDRRFLESVKAREVHSQEGSSWEMFHMRLSGTLGFPEISFVSQSRSFSLTSYGEGNVKL